MSFEVVLGILLGIAQVGGLILGLWLGHKWYKKRQKKKSEEKE